MALTRDTGHFAYAATQELWPFKEGTGTPAGHISTTAVTISGTPDWVLEASGYGFNFPNYTTDWINLNWTPPTTPDLTILYRGRKLDATDRVSGRWGVTSGGYCGAILPYSPGGTSYIEWAGGLTNFAISSLTWDQLLDTFVWRVNAAEQRMWRNGSDIGSLVSAPGNRSAGSDLYINKSWTLGDNQFVDLFGAFDGSLSDAECAELSANPWDLFLAGGPSPSVQHIIIM